MWKERYVDVIKPPKNRVEQRFNDEKLKKLATSAVQAKSSRIGKTTMTASLVAAMRTTAKIFRAVNGSLGGLTPRTSRIANT